MQKEKKILEKVVIRFSGDSGDGMQLTGNQFAHTSMEIGNDIVTFPDYPAEIRAPLGTVAGVSSFQLQIGQTDVYTPGDNPDVLVAMNPAALKANMRMLRDGCTIIVDMDAFDRKNLDKAGYTDNPIDDETLASYNLIKAPVTSLTKQSIKHLGLDNKSMERCKNMFALGMVYWMFSRPLEITEKFLEGKFKKNAVLVEANKIALEAGFSYAESVEIMGSYIVPAGNMGKGRYRTITGNKAIAWGFMAAAEKVGKQLFIGSYPITPASDIMHELSRQKAFNVHMFQAEDEIAAIASTIGAAYAGNIAVTTTSGPGLALKGEAIGLAVMAELPMVIVDVQRGGPSTGLPTKTEQSDLLQAMYGRNGESPVVVIAASLPDNCFQYAFEAVKIAVEHMTPVILLSDGYIGNSSQPWKVPSLEEMPGIKVTHITPRENSWSPYMRDAETLARSWEVPGTAGFEHRIGGLEKDPKSGMISYDPSNHQEMVNLRDLKIKKIADYIPDLKVEGDDTGEILLVGWGGTYGALATAATQLRNEGITLGHAHFSYINPMPKNTKDVFKKYEKIVVCELNLGQLSKILRDNFPSVRFQQLNKVKGLPFMIQDIKDCVYQIAKEFAI
jgi:2-oxoglutarate/2-oxoacid ferredoxin oxidoreductase subunit alpha